MRSSVDQKLCAPAPSNATLILVAWDLWHYYSTAPQDSCPPLLCASGNAAAAPRYNSPHFVYRCWNFSKGIPCACALLMPCAPFMTRTGPLNCFSVVRPAQPARLASFARVVSVIDYAALAESGHGRFVIGLRASEAHDHKPSASVHNTLQARAAQQLSQCIRCHNPAQCIITRARHTEG